MRMFQNVRTRTMIKRGIAFALAALAATALAAMAGCARVSTQDVQAPLDVLPRPQLILVHDYQVSPDDVQLDSALGSRLMRVVKGTPKTADELKVQQEV